MKPFLSIVVPAYNCQDYIAECLESVLRQMPRDCELIVVDDGSSDGTARILEKYGSQHGAVRILPREHRGASGARNAGLAAAEGEYVTFLDCDDCLADHFLEKALPSGTQEADLLIFGIERIFLTGRSEFRTVRDGIYPTVSDFADAYIRTRAMLIYSPCNKFYRRSVLEKARLRFDENIRFGEDRLFNYRYLRLLEGRSPGIAVRTSRQIMLRYIQRSASSLSARYIPHYFEQAMRLHRAKTDTFLDLSRGTGAAERRAFCSKDLGTEILQTVDRFALYPEEEEENLAAVNDLIFRRFPSLKDLLRECGTPDPEGWYRLQTARDLVIACLCTFYDQETGSPA